MLHRSYHSPLQEETAHRKCLHARKIVNFYDIPEITHRKAGPNYANAQMNFFERHLPQCSDCQEQLEKLKRVFARLEQKIPRPVCSFETINGMNIEVEELISGIALVDQLEKKSRTVNPWSVFSKEYPQALLLTICSREMLGFYLLSFLLAIVYFILH